jgi:hypothetical protein
MDCEHSLMSIIPTKFHGIWLLGMWSGSSSLRMMYLYFDKKYNCGDGDLSDKTLML